MIVDIKALSERDDLLEIARKAIEDTLVEWRDAGMSVLMRNNGLVIKSRFGRESSIIRMGPEDAMRIGLRAIAEHLDKSDGG